MSLIEVVRLQKNLGESFDVSSLPELLGTGEEPKFPKFWQSEQCKQNISGRECNPSRGSSQARKESDRAELSAWGEQSEEPLQCISRSVEREIAGAENRNGSPQFLEASRFCF